VFVVYSTSVNPPGEETSHDEVPGMFGEGMVEREHQRQDHAALEEEERVRRTSTTRK
jgi:hypothetical protein